MPPDLSLPTHKAADVKPRLGPESAQPSLPLTRTQAVGLAGGLLEISTHSEMGATPKGYTVPSDRASMDLEGRGSITHKTHTAIDTDDPKNTCA